MSTIILLLILFNVCHWLGDYTYLMRPSMLKAKMIGKPYLPIWYHAGVHAILFSIVGFLLFGINIKIIFVAIFQLITHFIFDTIKGKLNVFPEIKDPFNQIHWIVMGFDQFLHQVVIILLAFYLRGTN